MQNGNPPIQPQPLPPNHRQPNHPPSKDPIYVEAIPSVSLQGNNVIIGDASSRSTRAYTPLKVVGDGSFGTVWLCDWHGTLPPNTPLSAMQCGAGARPEWTGKRLVAVKRMKKKWEGGWDECRKLKELESLRAISYHPNIIPLYDAFLLPETKELYFVFESMEGNLYQLIKSRKGRPLAGGLVSSIFKQVVAGLHHIHASGYFHRDMKPENLLVTTTGLYEYTTVSPIAPPNAPPEKDVVVTVKLADFGLARETRSKPPYTEYVSTRWYRAPEVLLRARDYSNPVDMWALGTIMAELVNLRPMFPGSGEIDQVARICELLGDPCEDYGFDARGKAIGGGKWPRGVRMAKGVGLVFPKIQPKDIYALFDRSVPIELVDCISDLLKYEPDERLTSRQCLDHPYLRKTTPRNNPPAPPVIIAATQPPLQPKVSIQTQSLRSGASLPSVSPRHCPPSYSHSPSNAKPVFDSTTKHLLPPPPHIPDATASHRSSFYAGSSTSLPSNGASTYANGLSDYTTHSSDTLNGDVRPPAYANGNVWIDGNAQQPANGWPMDISSPQMEVHIQEFPQHANGHPMDIQTSPMAQDYPARPPMDQDHPMQHVQQEQVAPQGTKFSKLGLGFAKKHPKWLFGGHGDKPNVLTPVDELHAVPPVDPSPFSLKRTQSNSTDSQSISELSPLASEPPPGLHMDPKKIKKEAERVAREAEKQRRALAEKSQREQARAVMQKRNQVLMQPHAQGQDIEWKWVANTGSLVAGNSARAPELPGPEKSGNIGASRSLRGQSSGGRNSSTLKAAGGRFGHDPDSRMNDWRGSERMSKVPRTEWDDDQLSVSSSDVHSSIGRMSVMSFATGDSDPTPMRLRHRPSMFGIDRMTSSSSLRTSFGDEFPQSARSSVSLSLEQQLATEFHMRAALDPAAAHLTLPEAGSPPPMHNLTLSPSQQSWSQLPQCPPDVSNTPSRRQPRPTHISLPPPIQPRHPHHLHPHGASFDLGGQIPGHPTSPGVAPKSAINPIFKVPPLPSPSKEIPPSPNALPSFAHLEAVAEGEHPPFSPMSFTSSDVS
ncbi:hypothetical protein JAAARDRAFT_53741 [Jaapia argillacea MUCL 33604]|uniref:Protein kinase domain-containing protein n=1 Tax=Jaapia argillacea MUCL 33604 TaxID=933084 RepID=A0A067Q914_9AGAM|nr:hypothetical protein JAAARDRAFT_53741 [Jaapia argillacea MUCL 33604]